MKTITYMLGLALVGLLESCAINPHPMDMTAALQNAKSRSDHEALAQHYEDAAKEMRVKAEEHKKMLAEYQARKSLYSKQAGDLINHCQGLIRVFEQAAVENTSMAKLHREIASEMK